MTSPWPMLIEGPPIEPLTRDRVDLWFMPVSSADAEWLVTDLTFLSEEERTRAAAFRRSDDRVSFLVGRVILRRLLGAYAAVAPGDVLIQAPRGRKPVVAAPARAASIEFNLSHTPGLLVWAFALGRAVGVDAEHIPRMNALDPPPTGFFSPGERERLASAPASERALRLSQHWTLKEALVKALGTGLTLDVSQCAFTVGPELSVRCDQAGQVDVSAWNFCLFRPTLNHTAALCVQTAPGEQLPVRVCRVVPENPDRIPVIGGLFTQPKTGIRRTL